jgi:hypothetical protein
LETRRMYLAKLKKAAAKKKLKTKNIVTEGMSESCSHQFYSTFACIFYFYQNNDKVSTVDPTKEVCVFYTI